MKLSNDQMQELKDQKFSFESLKNEYFINNEDNDKLEVENVFNLLNENICSFQNIVDKFLEITDKDHDPILYRLFNDELFIKLRDAGSLPNKDNLEYLLKNLYNDGEGPCMASFTKCRELIKLVLETFSFQKLIEAYRNTDMIYQLLKSKEVFNEVIDPNTLTKEDIKHLLDAVKEIYDLDAFCENRALLKIALSNNLFDFKTVEKFNKILEDNEYETFDDEYINVESIFDLISEKYGVDIEIIGLSEITRKLYMLNNFDLTNEQKLEGFKKLKYDVAAQNRLKEIIDNKLETNYSFESLMQYLTKKDKKTALAT